VGSGRAVGGGTVGLGEAVAVGIGVWVAVGGGLVSIEEGVAVGGGLVSIEEGVAVGGGLVDIGEGVAVGVGRGLTVGSGLGVTSMAWIATFSDGAHPLAKRLARPMASTKLTSIQEIREGLIVIPYSLSRSRRIRAARSTTKEQDPGPLGACTSSRRGPQRVSPRSARKRSR